MSDARSELLVVLVTAPVGGGEKIARALIEAQLAACVNVLPPMRSIYRWQGAIENEAEEQLVIKTTRDRFEALEAAVRKAHPYEVPEIIALPAHRAAAAYEAWAIAATRAP